MRARPKHRRTGSVLIYVLVSLVTFSTLLGLAIDSAHVRVVKNQLQGAADMAARAAAQNLKSGVSAAQSAAVTTAAANRADGSAVSLNTSTDIDWGTWSNGTFTVLTGASQSSATAVRVRCTRSAARGTAVLAVFGMFVGFGSCDVTAQSTASSAPFPTAAFIGYAGITVKNNAFFGGYNSSVTINPTQNGSDSNVRVGTNSFITANNNDVLDGSAVLGPGATTGGISVLGTTYNLAAPIPTPTMPSWSPTTNPNGIAQAYTVNSTTTLPGGTYWFTSLTLNADLKFSGPATVYVNGNIALDGTLAPTSGLPYDLTIYQYGSGNTFGDSGSNGMNITATVFAPTIDFTSKNTLNYAGTGIFNTITTKNSANFFYDESHGPADGTYTVSTVQ
jgi:Flp pilus assembly protein TadG